MRVEQIIIIGSRSSVQWGVSSCTALVTMTPHYRRPSLLVIYHYTSSLFYMTFPCSISNLRINLKSIVPYSTTLDYNYSIYLVMKYKDTNNTNLCCDIFFNDTHLFNSLSSHDKIWSVHTQLMIQQ